MAEEPLISNIVNEDGTDFNPPVNPIVEKYKKPCMSYSCIYCDECPLGNHWKVPEEDREEYIKAVEAKNAYIFEHNPSMKLKCD